MNKKGFVSYFVLTILSSILLSFLIYFESVRTLNSNINLAIKDLESVFKIEERIISEVKNLLNVKDDNLQGEILFECENKAVSCSYKKIDNKVYIEKFKFE